MDDFAGLVAVVTGGASGIGAATTTLLTQRGARVVVLDRGIGDAAGVGMWALALDCDVSDRDAVQRSIERVVAELGGLDVLVNNAGIGAQGDVTANGDDEWRHVFDVNVLGIAHCSAAAVPYLRESGHAAVVNTSSVLAVLGVPGRVLYAATKGAVLALTLAMAADHVREGIRVNAVAPGTADTPWVARLLADAADPTAAAAALRARQPIGRLVTAEEVAHAIAYLASPLSGSTTGTVLGVDGGMAALRLPS
ncbi:MAG TPA: SDR family NAD(P)-dependent oxidoreductase [Actinomycetes bacterium]